ncbi:hypothetical protein [Candidatus Clostridium stratigraminis]|uniref:ENT domain-containing protein n=1 Tax=Candidatus Clostridium stratigraminis TaxID=3381661 RepID=A0ABW8T801_9CLOT
MGIIDGIRSLGSAAKDKLEDLKYETEIKMSELGIDDKISELKDNVVDKISDLKYEAEIKMSELGIDDKISEIKDKITQANGKSNEGAYTAIEETLPLTSMNDEIKKAYIKIICNFAYSNYGVIDSKEYAEIISLIVRTDYNSENRLEIRNYMCSNSEIEETNDLIQCISDNVPEGSLGVIKKSLLKDIIYIYKIKNDINNWNENKFIVSLQNKFDINDNQIDLIVAAINNDEEILFLRKNDTEITKSMKDLAAKAGAVGVPLAAIYFSGSVLGIGATGITSGLATLGMGGILGLSGMATGIGVVVLLGVGTYKGVKKLTGIEELENNKQREMMLQAIIKNSQKSLDYLIEDVNEISRILMEEIKNGIVTTKKIEKLSALLSMMSKGAKEATRKINYAESETVISHLPKTLDINRLNELTNEKTKEKLQGYILSCYIKQEVNDEDEKITKTEFILNDKLSLNQLEQLYSVFEAIGYTNLKDAALASAKGMAKSLAKSVFEKEN